MKLRDNELHVLEKSLQTDIPFKQFRIRTYEWANTGEAVLLVHGYSSKGETSPLEFAELVGQLLQTLNVKRCIAHSFGGVAVTYALFHHQEIRLERLVLITTPDRFSERISDVADRVGVSKKVQQRLIRRLAKQNIDVSAFNVSDFVQQINVDKALILHDINDKVLPIEQSRNVHRHWPQSRLVEVEGTGHFRILRTESVLDQVLEFIA